MKPVAVAVALGAVAILAGAAVLFVDDTPTRELPPAPPPMPSPKREPWATPAPETPRANLNRATTALWLRRQWLHTDVSESEVVALTSALREAKVTRVYPFLGGMNTDGVPGWRSLGIHTPYREAQVRSFLSLVHAAMPELAVLPWTGGVPFRDFRLDNPAQMATFTGHLKAVVEAGANGVHINMEPIANDDLAFVSALRDFRAALPPDAILSVAVAAPRHDLIQISGYRYYSFGFLRAICDAADELVVMGYDTWLEDRRTYETVVADWTEQLASELPPESCEWRMGVPTYDDDIPHHKLNVERIDVALRGVNRGLERAKTPNGFAGIALYASWTTDAQEWAAYDALWLGRDAGSVVIPEPAR